MGNRCPNLKSVDLSECSFVTDEGLTRLIQVSLRLLLPDDIEQCGDDGDGGSSDDGGRDADGTGDGDSDGNRCW